MTNKELFLKHQGQTTPYSLAFEVEKAEGSYIYNTKGEAFLDMVAGVSACSVGHRHPKVVQAVQQQMDKYWHVMVYGEFIQEPTLQLALEFANHLPKNLQSTYFVNSGVEAIEASIKLAKRVTGKTAIVSCKNSYHGSTNGALSIMGKEEQKTKFRPLLPDCHLIEYNNIDSLSFIDENTAGVIIEPIQGATGFILPTKEFMQALRDRCTEEGALLIFDEIQSCYGRLGKAFGWEVLGIVPDVICLAKGMGGGMPIGAFITSEENMKLLSENPTLGHITTFGGAPVSCAAALATWKIINNSEFLDSVMEKEKFLRNQLVHPEIKEITGMGLALGIHFDSADKCQQVFERLMEEKIITFFFLFKKEVLRLSPPLTITKEELMIFSEKLIGILNE